LIDYPTSYSNFPITEPFLNVRQVVINKKSRGNYIKPANLLQHAALTGTV